MPRTPIPNQASSCANFTKPRTPTPNQASSCAKFAEPRAPTPNQASSCAKFAEPRASTPNQASSCAEFAEPRASIPNQASSCAKFAEPRALTPNQARLHQIPRMAYKPRAVLECFVHGPFPVLIQFEGDPKGDGDGDQKEDLNQPPPPPAQVLFDPHGPACKFFVLRFPRPTHVGEIHFVNFYTACLSLFVKIADEWHLSIARRTLMRRPHVEEGSQDVVSLTGADCPKPWDDVIEMRLVLRQPSTEWLEFEIDRLVIYGDAPKSTINNVLYLGQHLTEMDAAVALARLNTDEALHSVTYEDCYEFASCTSYD